MEHIKAKIHHKHEWVVPLQRKGDKHIMDKFLESHLIPANEITLTDIVSSIGKRIRTELFDPEKFQIEEGKEHRLAPSTWSRQAESAILVKKLWKYALIKAVCNEQSVFHSPLGE
eukprot:9271289-Ditylum_brightwellii.AAC.1